MTSIRTVDDPDEFRHLIPRFAELHALLFAPEATRDEVRARREAVYHRTLSHPENSRVTAAIAKVDGEVVGFRAGALYHGSRSLWRDSFGGRLLVPRGDGVVPVRDATREHWAEKPVPHGLEVSVHPDYQGQGLGKAVAQAWGDGRPTDEEYATGHIAPANVRSLRTFRSLGAQVVGTREDGRYFYLLPLKGQSSQEVDAEVAGIQNDVPGISAALRGLGRVGDLARHPGREASEVALPIERAITKAQDITAQQERGR